jgi:hypothetical protein
MLSLKERIVKCTYNDGGKVTPKLSKFARILFLGFANFRGLGQGEKWVGFFLAVWKDAVVLAYTFFAFLGRFLPNISALGLLEPTFQVCSSCG